MNSLIANKDTIFKIRSYLKTEELYTHTRIHKNILSIATISIVMTASNRSKQTYFTLKTIQNSAYKDVHVILIDDSTSDPIDVEKLREFSFTIDFIRIRPERKIWYNPVVNYNIGFQFVRGGKVIIQNAEVCHIADVLTCVHNLVYGNKYFVFDIKRASSFDDNEKVYNSNTDNISTLYDPNITKLWIQSVKIPISDRGFHYLTAMTRDVFEKIGGFSLDYCFGSAYDDDDFVLKIKSKGIQMVSLDSEHVCCGGIHLFHITSDKTWGKDIEMNTEIFERKKKYFEKYGKYIEITDSRETYLNNLKCIIEL